MPFCSNCGEPLNEEERFCHVCGAAVKNAGGGQRQEEYAGKVIKCPHCGAELKSFQATCNFCGYELRGAKPVESVKELAIRLGECESVQQQIVLVRNFPVPNTKEDIIEFMITAASNFNSISDEKVDTELSDAWLAKVDQCYQKADLLFRDEPDFNKIQNIYDRVKEKIHQARAKDNTKSVLRTIGRNFAVVCGIVALIIAVCMDLSGGNASMVELIAYIVLIASACSLAKRRATIVDFLIGIASGIVTILASFLFDNGSMAELCGGIIIIAAAICYFISLSRRWDD